MDGRRCRERISCHDRGEGERCGWIRKGCDRGVKVWRGARYRTGTAHVSRAAGE